MNHQTRKSYRMLRPAWSLALVVVFALAMTTLLQSGSMVHAQEPDSNSGSQANTVPPPGNCWGGALSDVPLHCYALEEAQRDGIIEVEGVYDAWGELHIFFNYHNGPPVTALFDQGRHEELNEVLKANAREFVVKYPEQVTYNLANSHCKESGPAAAYRDCILDWTFIFNEFIPWDGPYVRIVMISGGAEGRRALPGWASWVQIWPAMESGTAGASDAFDVSDVDLTNFPEEMKCKISFYSDASCQMVKQFPSWNITGWHDPDKDAFMQVKAVPGKEDDAVHALRAEFARRYGDSDSYGYSSGML